MKNLILLISIVLLFSCKEKPKFEFMDSDLTGIDFKNTITPNDSFHVMSFEYIYNGAGVGIGDLNNDGLQDVVLAGNQVSSRIYINEGNFKFRDITSNFDGLDNEQWFSSVTIADINNDEWPDVYLTSTAGKNSAENKNRLWINNGSQNDEAPTFTEMAEQYGIAGGNQSVNAAFFDYDLDNDLDLYVLNNTLTQRMNTSYREKITDGSAENNDRLYRNNGDGTFTDVTIEAGILFEGFGLGLEIGDVNKDSYPDIYVSNDYISNDLLYINQGDGTFVNEIRKYLSYQTKSSMGNDMTDVNNDGYLDIFTLDMMPESYAKIKQTINGFSYVFYLNDWKYDFEHQYLRNMLHLHNGFMKGEMLPYSEVGQITGIFKTEWSWSPLFADYDNDGDKDLIVANGYPKDMTDKDWTRMKVEVYGSLADEQFVIDRAPAVKVTNIAYENTGKLKFVNRSKEWLPELPSYSYGAAFVDLDNDGDLDYITNNINDEAFVLKNNTMEKSKDAPGYIQLKLKGEKGNTTALGAKVELWSDTTYQYNEHYLTRGYASSVSPVVHFGLASQTVIDSIKVTWPTSGKVTFLSNIEPNQILELKEADAALHKSIKKDKNSKDWLFSKQKDLLNHTHIQDDFNDFFLSQNIIHHKFSQIGPVMRKGDLNNDGHDDLIIGATNKQPTMVYLRDGNGFKQTEIEGLTTEKKFQEADIAIVDIDNDGDMDVVAAAGGYENRREEEYQHFLYENNAGTFSRSPLPIPQFPASVVELNDFNKDGSTDIFIGARVKKGMYPYSNHSWVITNENGKLSADPAFKINMGMVTDAIWSDFDNDGWDDLIVTREWNSIVILKNINGEKLEPQNIPGMEDHHGFWYSIYAGDFDKDGDQDYIAGNLGQNHRFTINDEYPLQLYAIDLDLDGVIDPVSTGYWKNREGKMTEYPINYFDELAAQSMFFRRKFTDYETFSYTSIDEMFDERTLENLQFKLHVNTAASYVLWNEGDSFRWDKLPRKLQVSPINKMLVRDFNGDSYPDVLLSGNDYSFDVSTGYYDANKGFLLLSKGKNQGFEVLTPSETGILLDGMIQSLSYFEGDTSFIVAGFNRDKTIVYQVNE